MFVTVTGTVAHHTPESQSATASASNAPKSAQTSTHGANRNRANFDPEAPITSHPRAFSQNFVLVDATIVSQSLAARGAPIPGQLEAAGIGGVPCSSATGKDGSVKLAAKYFVQADSFRFVG